MQLLELKVTRFFLFLLFFSFFIEGSNASYYDYEIYNSSNALDNFSAFHEQSIPKGHMLVVYNGYKPLWDIDGVVDFTLDKNKLVFSLNNGITYTEDEVCGGIYIGNDLSEVNRAGSFILFSTPQNYRLFDSNECAFYPELTKLGNSYTFDNDFLCEIDDKKLYIRKIPSGFFDIYQHKATLEACYINSGHIYFTDIHNNIYYYNLDESDPRLIYSFEQSDLILYPRKNELWGIADLTPFIVDFGFNGSMELRYDDYAHYDVCVYKGNSSNIECNDNFAILTALISNRGFKVDSDEERFYILRDGLLSAYSKNLSSIKEFSRLYLPVKACVHSETLYYEDFSHNLYYVDKSGKSYYADEFPQGCDETDVYYKDGAIIFSVGKSYQYADPVKDFANSRLYRYDDKKGRIYYYIDTK